MCFVKKTTPTIVEEVSEPVIQKEADAQLTKNSQNNSKQQGYSQNIRTSALGLEDKQTGTKKTLLGE